MTKALPLEMDSGQFGSVMLDERNYCCDHD
jgi:hypothetical protein